MNSLIGWISLIAIILMQEKWPVAAFPNRLSRRFFLVVACATAGTFKMDSILGILFAWGAWRITIALMILGLLPPLAGLTENRLRSNGHDVFDLKRFPGHLLTNLIGALVAAAFVWTAASFSELDKFDEAFEATILNIALPLATWVALAFARSEQERNSGGLDLRKTSDEAAEPAIVGYSLRHVHQLLNTIFLTAVVFVSGSTMPYLFAQTISSAKAAQPLSVSWPVVACISLTLSFFLACGLPQIRESRTVWITFVTGTPAVLMFTIFWLALFTESALRVVAIMLVVAAYAAYCYLFLEGERASGTKIEPHHFSSVVIFVVITMLLSMIYVS